VEGSKKRQKSGFLKNQKIFDCEPTSATGELKKEVNVRILSKFKKKNKNSRKSLRKKNFFLKKVRKIHFGTFRSNFFFFCDNCTLEELLNASGLRKY
jgi:hypothetical protein